MQAVREARRGGLPVCTTIDAGPNVHLLCESSSARKVLELAGAIPGVREVRLAGVGGAARLVA
jgi:diphosphomevalonate decarboxylase